MSGFRDAGLQRANNRRLGEVLGGIGVSTGGNTAGVTGTVFGPMVLAAFGGITFSQSTRGNQATITMSVANETGIGLAAGTQTATGGVVVFSNSNGISFGMSGSSRVTASMGAPYVLAIRNATGGETQLGFNSNTIGFSGENGITWGTRSNPINSVSYITASIAAGGGAAIAAGTQTATGGTVVFANSNGISFGMSGSTQVTASHGAATNALLNGDGGPVNVGVQSNNFFFASQGGIGWTNTNIGGTQHILAQPLRVSYLENWRAVDLLGGNVDSNAGSLIVQRFAIPQARILATQLDCDLFISNSSSAGGTLSFRWGIYTMSGSTASLASSGSRTGAYNSTLAASSYTHVSNWRVWSVPIAWDLTPGDYLMAFNLNTASALTAATMSMHGGRNSTFLGEPYVAQNYSKYFDVGLVNTSGLPASIHLSAITQTQASNSPAPVFPWFKLIGSF